MTRHLPDLPALNELRQRHQWVAWNYEFKADNGKWSKVPKNPATGGNASVSNPKTWGSYKQAFACAQTRRFAGVGFVLTADDDLTGIDLDGCVNPSEVWFQELIAQSETYAEVSPSGNGARLLARGKIDRALKHDASGVEIYVKDRFLTITGDHLAETPTAIAPAPATLAALGDRIETHREAAAQVKAEGLTLTQRAARAAGIAALKPGTGSGFWRAVNDAALGNLDAWVPALLPAARRTADGGWRVTSRALGRDLEEDLSFHRSGIRDFGEESGQTAISIVQSFAKMDRAKDAAFWLCDRLGIEPAGLGWRATGNGGAPQSNAPDDLDLSQDALASGLGAAGWNSDARHVASWGKWLFWDGIRWQVDKKLDHMTRTREYLRERAEALIDRAERNAPAADAARKGDGGKLRRAAAEQAKAIRSGHNISAVESLARSNPASVASPEAFDADRLLLGTPGGTVDLRTGELRPAERADMITKLTACAPAEPGSRPKRWLAFLHEIFDGDADLVAFMQRAAGYALTGLTTEHRLLFLYGTGRNGKSVFLNTLTYIWGEYARRAPAETFLNTQGDKHATGLAGLQGARLVAGSELPVGKTWDEAVIKDLTGGDRMTARYMRGDFFEFDPQLTLMIAGNNQPSFRGVNEALRARVVLVPFLVTIPPEKRDAELAEKLIDEAPQILRWAIDGALRWGERGLDVPAGVAAASAEYMDDEDTLGQFLAEVVAEDPTGFVTTTALHEKFCQWSEKQGLKPWTLNTLQKELKSRGYQHHRRPNGRGFLGVKLT
jgi:P4 family phage/plasmid primase-like protien